MRTILHSDCNNFYASVECVYDPALRGKPVAVCGDPSARHGIILAKSDAAKRCGIKTGEAIWEARQKCPDLILLAPHGEQYIRFSKMIRRIYSEYTDRIEPFGLDESWLDVTNHPLGGVEIASRLRKRAKEELGLTVSVGVSFNKVFAKLGSDMHKPDATTVISPENFRDKIWPLPAGELLFIGRSTVKRLSHYGIRTIGDIACANPNTLHACLGKNGDMLYAYANGLDVDPVMRAGESSDVKSVSNSTTPPFDVDNETDARRILYLLSDSVASRLREQQLYGRTISLWVRSADLHSCERQVSIPTPTNLSKVITRHIFSLLQASWDMRSPLRSLGVRVSDLSLAQQQSPILSPDPPLHRYEKAECAMDAIRRRFGVSAIQRGCTMQQQRPLQIEDIHHNFSGANMSAIHGRGEGI
ncbi:MAG: DNA polymerase IV [Clostridia bacterium]|nr:DNA polymerase IV [Clostridia bacterium]